MQNVCAFEYVKGVKMGFQIGSFPVCRGQKVSIDIIEVLIV